MKGPSEEDIWNTLKDFSPNVILVESCKIGFLEGVKDAIENDADVNQGNGYPLYLATENGHIDIVKFLLENGAKVSEDKEEIEIAIRHRFYEIVELLLEKCDITKIDFDSLLRQADNLKDTKMKNILIKYKK